MNRFVNYTITPEETPNMGIMFVDHEKNQRSGHLSHALVEYKKGHIMAFYSNCRENATNGLPVITDSVGLNINARQMAVLLGMSPKYSPMHGKAF